MVAPVDLRHQEAQLQKAERLLVASLMFDGQLPVEAADAGRRQLVFDAMDLIEHARVGMRRAGLVRGYRA